MSIDIREEYPLSINYFKNGQRITLQCKEFPVLGKSYSKIISTNNDVAIIYVPVVNYTYSEINGWSTCYSDKKIKEKLIFDSTIVKIINNQNFDGYISYIEKHKILNKNNNICNFNDLRIYFIPSKTYFKINKTIGGENIEIFNFRDFYKA
jgi:hypothetical protein